MNIATLKIAALTGLIGLSSAALAQTSPPPTQTQMQNNANTQNRENSMDPQAVHRGQKEYFTALDIGNKGYLTNDDVAADAFLSKNYPKCDVDHDGKLTWDELKACTRNNPATAQQH